MGWEVGRVLGIKIITFRR